MKQRVTDEQAKILCSPQCSTECQTCIASEFCRENGVDDLAADLLYSRELIKEMLPQLVYSRAGLEAYEAESTGETYNSPSLNSIIEKAKEYIAKKCAE